MLRGVGQSGRGEIAGCDVVRFENAVERGNGDSVDAGSATEFFFLDGGEDGFVVEERDGGILIEAGDA